ncbi:ABC transporter ATP-binding protein [Haloarcula marina]|uniref:ABC transporter ATP-binding protein n=1 Tax=Haloarcula marina TaxID=2961574 RepID=UPI0020B814B5|nr:ABC transporter ATP-binding protein [Halomicroarcula marina]
MTHLEFDDVTKRFNEGGTDEVTAVDTLNATIDDGEFVVFVGPSGCGKTTTLRSIAGLETISDGEIRLNGEPLNDRAPQDRNIAMVFQSYALYPHLTVRKNMSFGLEQSTDLSKSEISHRVEETASLLGISELLDRLPEELSGGQQQRVALGRAIVRDPDVFLMDEPLSNLDAKLRSKMRTELQQLQNQLDVTTIYVTHDQTEAMTMGDRIAILNGGELQQLDPPEVCYHQPNNKFVAGFLGEPSMNFFDVRFEDGTLRGSGFDYALSDDIAPALKPQSEYVLGIRPEDIQLYPEATDSNDTMGSVNVTESLGKESNIYVELDQGSGDTTAVATVDDAVARNIRQGDDVALHVEEAVIHIFDAATGKAVHNRRLDSKAETPSF